MENEIEGIWFNQHGSQLDLRVHGQAIEGTFRSAGGLAGPKQEVLVVGFASRQLVSFVANLSEQDSLTAWTGHVVQSHGEPTLELQWLMAVGLPGRDPTEDLWRGTWVGADVFRRRDQAEPHRASRSSAQPFPDWP